MIIYVKAYTSLVFICICTTKQAFLVEFEFSLPNLPFARYLFLLVDQYSLKNVCSLSDKMSRG